MECVKESIDQVWRSVKVWLRILASEITNTRLLSMHDLHIL